MIDRTNTFAAPGNAMRTDLLKRDVERRSKLKKLSKVTVDVRQRNDMLPRLRLTDRQPASLSAPKRNVRAVEGAHVREVANAIRALGFNVPVIIDNEDMILDGVVRVEAAKLLNLPLIPCIVADSLTKSEQKLLRLTINRLSEKGSWDFDELKLEFEDLIIDDAPIEISGFELPEIDSLLCGTSPAAVEQGPVAPRAGGNPVSRIGDLYRLGQHRILCGDATDAAVMRRLMAGEVARFVFTDQPYNVPIAGHVTGGAHREFAMASGEMSDSEFRAFNAAWIQQAESHLMDGGVLATFIDWRGLVSVSVAATQVGLSQLNLVVWGKTNAGMGSLYRSQHELMPLFRKGSEQYVNNVDLGRNGRWRSNLWTYPGASTIGSDARKGLQQHPTVKPVVMLVDALADLTNRDDIVLDPFLGSGSTLIAAEKSGRVCRGLELDPLYVDVIVRRYQNMTGRSAILEDTGETFSAVEQRRLCGEDPSTSILPIVNMEAAEQEKPGAPLPVFRKRTRLQPAA